MPLPTVPKEVKRYTYEGETVKQRSKKQEKFVAKATGGRVQPASGALEFAKGDVKTRSLLIECKTTRKGSYSMQRAVLEKIAMEAKHEDKTPALFVTFEAGPCGEKLDWVCVPASLLRQLQEAADNK